MAEIKIGNNIINIPNWRDPEKQLSERTGQKWTPEAANGARVAAEPQPGSNGPELFSKEGGK